MRVDPEKEMLLLKKDSLASGDLRKVGSKGRAKLVCLTSTTADRKALINTEDGEKNRAERLSTVKERWFA